MKRYLSGMLMVLAGYLIAFTAHSAEPNFETMRPDVYYTNGNGYYLEGDPPCQDRADNYNANPDRAGTYLNAAFSDVNGEGCDYDLYRHPSGEFLGRVHNQNWVNRVYICSNGYNGPSGDGSGGLVCARHPLLPVVKPPICPDCVVGNPIDIAAADKVLTCCRYRHYRWPGIQSYLSFQSAHFFGSTTSVLGPSMEFGPHTDVA
ncbi:MAG: hypothetical protein WKF61_06695 [Luteimonas sp.]